MKASSKIALTSVAVVASSVLIGLATAGTFSDSSNVLIGNTKIEPWGYILKPGQTEAFKIKDTSSGTIGAFHLWVGALNTATSIDVGLYSDSEGHAGSLITSGIISSPKKGEWNEVALKPSSKIEAGTVYWLAFLGQGGELRYRDAHQPCASETNTQTNLTSLPQTWGSGTTYPECVVSAYITAGEESTVTVPTTPTTPVTTPTETTPTNPISTASCTTTISSGLKAAIESSPSGADICLNSGSYGNITINTKKTGNVIVESAPSVRATVGFINVENSNNLTFKNLNIDGGNIGSESSPATNISFIGSTFSSGLCVRTPTSASIDVLVEGNTFFNIGESDGGCGNEGRVEVNAENKRVSGNNGVVISHNMFGRNGCTDGVNITGGATGTQIGPGNVFESMKEGSCKAHVDPIQFYGAENNTIIGNYFHGNSTGIMSPDGNGSPMKVENNVFDTDGEYPNQIVIGGGGHDFINHNTFGHGASIRIGHVNVGATANNETITNNILTGGISLTEGQSSNGWTMNNNLAEGETLGSSSINGKPTYAGGGFEPSTWVGWELATGSLGISAASNGTNIGSNYFGH